MIVEANFSAWGGYYVHSEGPIGASEDQIKLVNGDPFRIIYHSIWSFFYSPPLSRRSEEVSTWVYS